MSSQDLMNYILYTNPVSSTAINALGNMLFSKQPSTSDTVKKLPPAIENLQVSKLVFSGNPFIKIAGLSGAAAVILGAYGAHTFYVKEGYEERKRIYQTANTYHFIHSLALFGAPLSTYPKAAGSLITIGMLLFCGTCYFDAFTGKEDYRKFTPVGGTCLIFGWLCLLL